MVLAWAPFAALWSLLTILTFDTPPIQAVRIGVNSIGWAAVLGAGVWYLTGRLPWPARVRPTFYLVHVFLGLTFSGLWLLLSTTTGLLMAGDSLGALVENMTPFIEWRLLTGLWLYGLVAGVGYAIRIRQALVDEQRAAAEANALAVQAQLDSLRARLNPHFFFNALHALSGLIHRDPAQADDALDRIGQLLRRTLATDGVSPVTVEEEWQFASEYLDLERLRLGERLRLDNSIAADARLCLVPSFTIQPLVENAVLHAIAPRIGGGSVNVEVCRSNGRLTIRVSDDGPGLTTPSDEVTGHGLDLLRRRLDAFYGDDARLSIGTRGEGGCEAVVELPARETS